jgi:hypothetical protein
MKTLIESLWGSREYKSLRSALLVVFAIQLGYCQTRLELHDTSAPKSPVQMSGIVSFSDDASKVIRSYQVESHFHNVSNKDVSLIIAHFATTVSGPALNFMYQKDFFFSLNALRKGHSEDFRSEVVRLKFAPVNQLPHTLERDDGVVTAASAEVLFIQFADGTNWGDSEDAQDALIERQKTLQELDNLEAIFRERGEKALTEELAKSADSLPCIGSLRNTCTGKPGSCLGEGVRSMIEAAYHHELELRRESSVLIDGLR